MNQQTPYVYAYYRPGGEVPFYIGKGQHRRLTRHLTGSHSPHVKNIIDQIVMDGGKPEFRVLAYFRDHEEAYRVERALIASYGREADGGSLVNIFEGGEGGGARPVAVREKVAAALRGKKQSAETIEKRVARWRGVPRPKEFTEPCRLAKIGKPRSQDCKDKVATAKRKLNVDEVKEVVRLRNMPLRERGETLAQIAKRYGVCRATLQNYRNSKWNGKHRVIH